MSDTFYSFDPEIVGCAEFVAKLSAAVSLILPTEFGADLEFITRVQQVYRVRPPRRFQIGIFSTTVEFELACVKSSPVWSLASHLVNESIFRKHVSQRFGIRLGHTFVAEIVCVQAQVSFLRSLELPEVASVTSNLESRIAMLRIGEMPKSLKYWLRRTF